MLTTPLAFAFVLGVLVFVHELGHFLLARWHGVRVHTFSLGFGPKLLSFKKGDTEYCLSLIPLGGYVKMAGENPDDNPQGATDEFMSKSKWQRFQILLAGPAMNMILAVLVLAVVLMQGDRVLAFLSRPAVIGVVQADSPAAAAGIAAGDEIVKINGRAISTWEELDMAVSSKPDLDVEFVRAPRHRRAHGHGASGHHQGLAADRQHLRGRHHRRAARHLSRHRCRQPRRSGREGRRAARRQDQAHRRHADGLLAQRVRPAAHARRPGHDHRRRARRRSS